MQLFKPTKISLALSSLLFMSACSTAPQQEKIHKEIISIVTTETTEDKSLSKETVPYVATQAPIKEAPKFNLQVKNAPISSILNSLIEDTDFSLITPEEISGNITLNLKNVSAFDVFEILKNKYHYDYEVDNKQITFYPNGAKTKIFVMNHLTSKRKGNSELKVSSGSLTENVNGSNNNNNGQNNYQSNQTQSTSTKITTSFESDFWKDLSVVLNSMVNSKESQKVIVSPETNTIIVTATPKETQQVEKYLKKIQAIVDKQVIIEAKIIEVELNNGVQTGINWAAFRNRDNKNISVGFGQGGSSLSDRTTSNTISNGNITSIPGDNLLTNTMTGMANSMFSLAFQTNNFASILNFLETQGNLQVLSSPRIATTNNQKAILKVGTDEFFITNVTTTNTSTSAGTTVTPSVTTQPFFSGIALDITPQIDDNGLVTMHVHPTVSQVSTVTKNIDLGTMGNIVLPLASSTLSETDSIVKIENNRIVAIGGLMKQYSKSNKNKVPGLGDAPVVGHAFKNTNEDLLKYELVILIKPTVINSQSDWDKNLEQIKARLSDFSPKNKNIVINGEQDKKE